MSYLDQILDQFGEDGDKVIYELYLQNRLEELCDVSVDDFEEVYFALFDDDIEEMEDLGNLYIEGSLDDYSDRINIMYTELLCECKEKYSYVRFLCEIDRKQWADIIETNMELQKDGKDVRIFRFYNNLRNGRIITWEIPGE